MASIDGNNNLHGMGIIVISTPKGDIPLLTGKSQMISREQCMKVTELVKNKGISISQYIEPIEKGLQLLSINP